MRLALWDILDNTHVGKEGAAQDRICKKQFEKEEQTSIWWGECMSEWVSAWTVVSTDKPLKRLCGRALLSLRLLKEHMQPWSDLWFSWGRFNKPALSAIITSYCLVEKCLYVGREIQFCIAKNLQIFLVFQIKSWKAILLRYQNLGFPPSMPCGIYLHI